MRNVIINDRRTVELLKGKKYVSDISASTFQGYADVFNGAECTAVILELDEIEGVFTLLAEGYPEDASEGTEPQVKHFALTDTTTINEMWDMVVKWVQEPSVAP